VAEAAAETFDSSSASASRKISEKVGNGWITSVLSRPAARRAPGLLPPIERGLSVAWIAPIVVRLATWVPLTKSLRAAPS
jgi:hypothetical protein